MTPNKIYKQIKLIYIAVATGLAIFFAFSFFYVLDHGPVMILDYSMETNLKSLIIILALAGIPASYMFHNRMTKHINRQAPSSTKMTHYRMAFFIKIITLEGLALLSLLVYLATSHITYISIFGLLFLVFLINYPNKTTIREELEIEESDFNN